ncbi:DEAD/DEAH box helicase [Streptomonospora litoralis]|uniref:DEAD-box ATP-dependent RNA helicase CshA n=1 Tax=Streptomonospora litoralis TaxID=2498135 RepID=A0A4P6Q432_9ACTN|nr:DEAD/DEAH box helicase [Streptomonospora litoralis]QBI53584.1 DEAD-box ATP-dependent RNA helicase CshA [Streptomonospora litoralis]
MATDATETAPGFTDLPLRGELLDALSRLGYEEPTPIQREAIPPLVEGRDLLGQAATGTGKTAAFALPILERMEQDREGLEPMSLVLVPTRELAVQVCEAVHRYGRDLGVRVLPVYGGQPIGRQIRGLERGVDVVVATPGRALDHLGRGTLSLSGLRMTVLDEADEMFDMGFAEDIEAILEEIPQDCQTVLFSATMPPRIERMAGGNLTDPVRIQIARETRAVGEAPLVRQSAYVVPRAHKPAAIGRILDVESPTAAIVFCRTREEVDQLTEVLNGRGHRAEALHGGMSQEQRDRTMGRLRSGTTDLVIATDVAARGLDVEHLTHVLNYNVPSAPDSYVHRVGRVGRAGREGVAITLVEPREHRMLKSIRRATDYTINVEKIPTIADARARRLELTSAALRETLLDEEAEDDREHMRVVVESLADEFDVMEVALAAVKLAHESQNPVDDDVEIPEVSIKPEQKDKGRGRRDGGRRDQRGDRGDRGERGERREQRGGRAPAGGMSRLFIGAGRGARVRPQDLVGAITGESELRGRDIGAIEIAERFSLVEVPSQAADDVISALQNTTIKGRKTVVRRDAKDVG